LQIRCKAHHNINEHLKKLIYSDMESNAEIQAPGLAHLLFAIPPPKRTVPVLLRYCPLIPYPQKKVLVGQYTLFLHR
jgi:hypothetical protein